MNISYKIPSDMIKDHAIVLPDGTEVSLFELVDGFIDLANSAGSANDIVATTGTTMARAELWYGMMARLNRAVN